MSGIGPVPVPPSVLHLVLARSTVIRHTTTAAAAVERCRRVSRLCASSHTLHKSRVAQCDSFTTPLVRVMSDEGSQLSTRICRLSRQGPWTIGTLPPSAPRNRPWRICIVERQARQFAILPLPAGLEVYLSPEAYSETSKSQRRDGAGVRPS